LRSHVLCAILVGALCAALYGLTVAPSATWYDMAELPAAAYFLGIAHSTGYPLYLLLGKLASFVPLGDIGYRVNLCSAAFATLTVVIVFFIAWDLSQRRGAAALAALTLGASSTLWANATQAETHALNALFTALITYLLLTWQRTGRRAPLLAAFAALGLAMGNHHLIQFFGPAMPVYWAMVSRQKSAIWESRLQPRLPLLALLFLAGFAINLYLPIRAAQKPVMMWADASDWRIFWRMVATGQGSGSLGAQLVFDPLVLWARLRRLALFPPYELTLIGLALALWGAVRLWRGNRALMLYALVGSGLTFLFMLSYGIHDVYDYFLPLYVMASTWLGVGTAALLERLQRWPGDHGVEMAPGRLLRLAPLVASFLLLGLPAYLVARDYPVLDRSQDDSSYLYANYLIGRLEKDSHLLCDFWTWAPLVYYQSLSGWRPDVSVYGALTSQTIVWEEFIPELQSGGEAIYVASGGPLPPGLLRNAQLHPVGLHMIETVADASVPEPQYKDLRPALGNVYRVVDRPPLLAVDIVPEGRRVAEMRYGGELSLVGFGGPTAPQLVGSTFKLTYYWVLDKATSRNYYVQVRLVDNRGEVPNLRGVPLWDHSHVIGGLTPTSTWQPGVIMGERYDALISWRVKPGRYTVKAWVYEDNETQRLVGSAQGVALGEIEVLARQGPFDVTPQNIPRE
jgi:hypothetical protein